MTMGRPGAGTLRPAGGRHDLRLVRRPHRAGAGRPPRRQSGVGQLRHAPGDRHLRPGRHRAAVVLGRGRRPRLLGARRGTRRCRSRRAGATSGRVSRSQSASGFRWSPSRWCPGCSSRAGSGWSSRCRTPVILWSAWPFHRATLVNLRHGATTMDTLVSLGHPRRLRVVGGRARVPRRGRPGHERWARCSAAPATARTSTSRPQAAIVALLLLGKYFEARARAPLEPRAARAARARRQDRAPRERRRDPRRGAAGRRPLRRAPGREDRHRRHRGRRRVGGRRVDAHRRAGAGRRRTG